MKQNIVLFNDSSADVVIPMKDPMTSNYTIVTYRLSDDKHCYVTDSSVARLVTNSDDPTLQSSLSTETKTPLHIRLKKLLLEVDVQTK